MDGNRREEFRMLARETQHVIVRDVERPHVFDPFAVLMMRLILRQEDRRIERRLLHEPQQLAEIDRIQVAAQSAARQSHRPQHQRRAEPGEAPRPVPATGAPGAVADDMNMAVNSHGRRLAG
jgi:hypothetical protein